MAVHRLTTPSPPTSPRRSPRLSLPTRKRARVSDSDKQLTPSSSKLPLTPDPSPRWIRANKRQKLFDASSSLPSTPPATPPNQNGSTRAGKRKSLDHLEFDTHRIVRKKRKENIVKDAPSANATTSSLKISVTQDTRQGGANNNTGQSQSLKVTRNTRSMTRTMKKSSPDAQPRVDSSLPPDSPTRSHISANGSISILPTSSLTIPSVISQAIDTKSVIPTFDVGSTTPTTGAITNDTQPSPQDSIQCPSPDSTPPLLSKSPLEISTSLIMPLPISISSLPVSFMNVPLTMPLNLAFMNMPLSMPLPMPLNIPISADISATLAPSESELGFGFHPQEEFSSTGREGKGNGEDAKEGDHVFPQQLSTPPLLSPARPTTNESTTARSSSDIFLDCPPSSPPQSCTPCLNPTSTTPTRIPPRLTISTCLSDPSPSTSTSPTSTTSYSFINSTSPTHSSPLKVVCFPSLPLPQQQHEHRMKDWPMDIADGQRQTEPVLDQEMGMELSLSFRNSSTGQGDEMPLTQQVLEEERSPLIGPTPSQPSSPPPPDSYPQLAPPFPSCPPSPACCSSSSSGASPSSSSSSRQHHKKVEYQPEWTPKLDKERNLWKLACKIRVWEITKRYTPDTIRTVVAQEAHDYYSAHGFPLGYGSVPVRSRKRRRLRKIDDGGVGSTTITAGLESDCASSMTPSLSSSPSLRDDEFMNEETYSFELMDDDDDMDGGGLRSMEDEWRYEGFEDDEFDDEDEDEDEDYDDLYEEDEDDDDEMDEVVEGDGGDGTKMTGIRKKKGDVSIIASEDQDQDPDGEGEMEIDIEPFQDPSFNAELSSPTSPSSTISSKPKSKSKLGDEPQSFVSSFYIPPVPPHVQQHMMQMQQQQQQEEEEVPVALDSSSSLDSSSTNSPVSSSSEGTPISTFDTVDHSTATPSSSSNNENNHTPMQIHLPPAPPHHPHHYHSQLIQFSSNILPLPPPRLDSVRVFILRQSEMGGMKTTGRGTPADRKRGAIWCGVQLGGGQDVSGDRKSKKRRLDDGKESESSESDEDENDDDDEGGKRGRPRLRLMLSDHDVERGPRSGGGGGGAGGSCEDEGAKHKPSSSTFVATDQTWDAFLASLDDKTHQQQQQQQPPQQQQPQQQGEVGMFDSSVIAADSDIVITHGQLLLDLDCDGLSNQHRERESPLSPTLITTTATRRLGPTLLPTSASLGEGSRGMFMFDHRDEEDDGSCSRWYGDDDDEGGGGGGLGGMRRGSGLVVVGSSSGTCPSDALAMEGGFNFSSPSPVVVGPDGTSTLSYALG